MQKLFLMVRQVQLNKIGDLTKGSGTWYHEKGNGGVGSQGHGSGAIERRS